MSCSFCAPTVSAICALRTTIGFCEPVWGRLMLHFAVDLGSEQNDDRGNPEPRHEADDGAERSIGGVEITEIGCVPGKATRHDQPEESGERASKRDPAPPRCFAAVAIDDGQRKHEDKEHRRPMA